MSDTTIQPTPALAPEGHGPAAPTAGERRAVPVLRRYVWWLVALAVIVVAEVLLRWANTRPGYDPYGWLDWGYGALHGTLNLGGAPSWKPFTFIFTVPFSLFGRLALHLWMLTSVSVSLAGVVFGGRIAYRLTRTRAGADAPAWPAWVAAVFGGLAVLGMLDGPASSPHTQQYFHYVLSAQSDSMLTSVCLAAVDMYLSGRKGWAWWLAILAGLGRPELWAFTGPWGLWILWKRPSMRWMVIAGGLLTAFLWFGVPWITNGRPDVAGQLALKSPRECTTHKITCTIDRFRGLNYLPVELAALLAVVMAVIRRDRAVLALAGCVVLWVVVEIAFVLHGFPGVPRYLFEAGGLTAVLAGVAVGWLLSDASEWHPRLPRYLGVVPVLALIALCVPHVRQMGRIEHKDILHERNRTWRILQLGAYIDQLGGSKRVQGCGGALLNVEYVSVMAWYLRVNTGQVAYQPNKVLKRSNPVLYFIPLPNGWLMRPLRPQRARTPGCASLRSVFVPTAHHPWGVLVPQ